jgi:hypothetical protein
VDRVVRNRESEGGGRGDLARLVLDFTTPRCHFRRAFVPPARPVAGISWPTAFWTEV